MKDPFFLCLVNSNTFKILLFLGFLIAITIVAIEIIIVAIENKFIAIAFDANAVATAIPQPESKLLQVNLFL
ncbi:hypothetical protein ACFLSV_03100 [Bacteroidota bacterium]